MQTQSEKRSVAENKIGLCQNVAHMQPMQKNVLTEKSQANRCFYIKKQMFLQICQNQRNISSVYNEMSEFIYKKFNKIVSTNFNFRLNSPIRCKLLPKLQFDQLINV